MPDGMEPQARHEKDPDDNKPLLSHSAFLSPEVNRIFGAYHLGIKIPTFFPKSRATKEYLTR
jgi:hypothetical protein